MADVTGAILAGGQGARLGGRDKGLLLLAGRPLVARVSERLRDQVAGILICANRHAAEYSVYGTVVADREPGFRGPLAGIDAALAACASAWLLTVPVDCPQPPVDLARRLRDAAESAQVAAAAARVRTQREPLFAIYRRDTLASLSAALKRDLPVWRWQDEIGVVDVDFGGPESEFANLNSSDEFRRWEEGGG